jgi:hypothetical protein
MYNPCDLCGEDMSYLDTYDSYYCFICRELPECSDEECEFCKDRPNFPDEKCDFHAYRPEKL